MDNPAGFLLSWSSDLKPGGWGPQPGTVLQAQPCLGWFTVRGSREQGAVTCNLEGQESLTDSWHGLQLPIPPTPVPSLAPGLLET